MFVNTLRTLSFNRIEVPMLIIGMVNLDLTNVIIIISAVRQLFEIFFKRSKIRSDILKETTRFV